MSLKQAAEAELAGVYGAWVSELLAEHDLPDLQPGDLTVERFVALMQNPCSERHAQDLLLRKVKSGELRYFWARTPGGNRARVFRPVE